MAHRVGLRKLGQVFSHSLLRKQCFLNGIPWKRKLINGVSPKLHHQQVTVTFITSDGERTTVQSNEGEDLLDIIRNTPHLDAKLEGFGSCGGTCSCSTCHVILNKKDYDRLPEIDTEGGEVDMLGIVPELTDTSRLGCQVNVTKAFDGMVVRLPKQAPPDARNDDLTKI